jgi:hypothetical protein
VNGLVNAFCVGGGGGGGGGGPCNLCFWVYSC